MKTRTFDYLKSEDQCEQGLAWLKSTPSVALYHAFEDRLHPTATAIQELAVAKRVKHLIGIRAPVSQVQADAMKDVLDELPYDLTSQQIAAVKTSLSNGISCITGGAGTGKTTVLSSFLKAAERVGYEIHAVALSGRAAMRLQESVGYTTMTIARFLREEPVVCPQGSSKLLVIDEASMIDLPTMFSIINHIDPSVRIVLTGDPSQLPPIGIGKILHDLVLSGRVPNTTLDIVKRQKGSTGIPEYSKQVNAGVVPESLNMKNICFYEIGSNDLAIQKAIDLYTGKPEDSRIIVPTRKLAMEANARVQESLNGESPLMNFNLHGEEFLMKLRLNDPVLFTQNHHQVGVQNGSLGELISVTQLDDVIGLVRLDTGETIEITSRLIDALDLGYAMTLHKAQGSQFSGVIILLKSGRVTDRSWLYTAITRAQSEVHIIGSADVFEKITRQPPKAFKRKTLLAPLLDYIDEGHGPKAESGESSAR